MELPAHLRCYPCDDDFASEWAAQGLWDEPAQPMLIVPAAEPGRQEGFGRPI